MPRRMFLPAQLVNQQPAPVSTPPRTTLGQPVWVRAVWLVQSEERGEQVPATLLHREGGLSLCAWFEPRTDADQFWFLDRDVRPRDTSGSPAAVDPQAYRYPRRTKVRERDRS